MYTNPYSGFLIIMQQLTKSYIKNFPAKKFGTFVKFCVSGAFLGGKSPNLEMNKNTEKADI